ncbi:MAG: cupin-like domain-containing protein [Bacteroidia bacterium]|nr:cupin-like domain-containing protein [Bacteroidia bacterium]
MPFDLSLKADVIEVENLTDEYFRKNYLLPKKPLLIKGLANQQPAGKKWTIDFFRREMGSEIIEILNNEDKANGSSYLKGNHKIQLKEFLDIIEKDEYTPLRMFAIKMFNRNPELKKDWTCPAFFRGILSGTGYFFMGGKDTKVHFHYDVDNNDGLLVHFYGKKRLILIEPKYSEFLYQLPFCSHSFVDLDNIDYEKYPGLHHVKGYEIIQEAGDGVYIPASYWHYNKYLSGGIAVSYRKLNHNLWRNVIAIGRIIFYLPLDKTLTWILKDHWKNFKIRQAEKQVNASIRRLKNEREPLTAVPTV